MRSIVQLSRSGMKAMYLSADGESGNVFSQDVASDCSLPVVVATTSQNEIYCGDDALYLKAVEPSVILWSFGEPPLQGWSVEALVAVLLVKVMEKTKSITQQSPLDIGYVVRKKMPVEQQRVLERAAYIAGYRTVTFFVDSDCVHHFYQRNLQATQPVLTIGVENEGVSLSFRPLNAVASLADHALNVNAQLRDVFVQMLALENVEGVSQAEIDAIWGSFLRAIDSGADAPNFVELLGERITRFSINSRVKNTLTHSLAQKVLEWVRSLENYEKSQATLCVLYGRFAGVLKQNDYLRTELGDALLDNNSQTVAMLGAIGIFKRDAAVKKPIQTAAGVTLRLRDERNSYSLNSKMMPLFSQGAALPRMAKIDLSKLGQFSSESAENWVIICAERKSESEMLAEKDLGAASLSGFPKWELHVQACNSDFFAGCLREQKRKVIHWILKDFRDETWQTPEQCVMNLIRRI